jgi:acyl carrier protein
MTLAVLGDLIGDELGCGPVALDTILADLPGWDSVAMAGVMLALEDRFGVMLERTSVDGVNTAGDLLALVKTAGADIPGAGG